MSYIIKEICGIMLIFFMIDYSVIPNKARWFILHTISNTFTTYYTLGSVINVLSDPIKMLSVQPSYTPLNITIALHLYHIVFFNNLVAIDWIHHILMCGIAAGSYFYNIGECTNFIIFFINGLPGGLDYLMLSLVKHGKIHYMIEKRLNAYINLWIRSPGIICGIFNLYLAMLYSDEFSWISGRILILVAFLWNAQYFLYRVIRSYVIRSQEKSTLSL